MRIINLLASVFLALLMFASASAYALPKIYYPQNTGGIDAALGETGKRRRCLTFSEIDAVIPLKSNKAIFVDKDGKNYVNNFISGCRFLLDPEGTLQFQLSSGNFCRNDRLYVFGRAASAPSGSCAIGDFKVLLEPMTLTAPAEVSPPDELRLED